jgi:hypothetical protein
MYRDYIENKRKEWKDKTVSYEGKQYRVIDVDYNGALLIDKPAQFTDTTAISEFMLDRE